MSTDIYELADPTALDRVAPIDQRMRLMISYLQLYKHAVVDRPLPARTFVELLRDASPAQRSALTLRLLELQRESPQLGVTIPTELLVLAVYETDDLSALVARLPWTEPIRRAIEDVSTVPVEAGKRRTIPLELRRLQATFGGEVDLRPMVHVSALLRLRRAADVLAALGNYRRLRRAGVLSRKLPSELCARVVEGIADPSERISVADYAHRAEMLDGRHYTRVLLTALPEIEDGELRVETVLWYLDLVRLGSVDTAPPPAVVARAVAHLSARRDSERLAVLLERLPEELVDDVSVQAALETAPDLLPEHADAAVPGALWRSIRAIG
jgi:hypothetical protein